MTPERKTLLIYALPAVALAVPTLPVHILLPGYYAESVGLGLTATGLVLFLVRLFDVVSDPLIGLAMDRLRYPGGRFRLPMVLGAAIAGPALWMLFTPPASAGPLYLGVWAAALYLGWTLIQIPYVAWSAAISRDYHGRTRLNGGREAATLIGLLLAGAVPAAAAAAGWAEGHRLQAVAVTTIGLGLLFLPPLLAANPAGGRAPHLPRWEWRPLIGNRLFLRLNTAWFFNGLANGLPAAVLPLYLTYGLDADDRLRPMLILIYFVAGLAAMPLWLRVSRNLGKHRAWCLAMLLACAAFAVVPLLGPGDVIPFAVVCLLTGLALGADLALPPALQGDLADWDRCRFGGDRTGTYFAVSTMVQKLALALGVGLAFPLLDLAGIGGRVPAEGVALVSLVVIYAGLPTVLKGIAVAIMWRHPLTARRHAAVQRRLIRREVVQEA